jgi:hypothetical protein
MAMLPAIRASLLENIQNANRSIRQIEISKTLPPESGVGLNGGGVPRSSALHVNIGVQSRITRDCVVNQRFPWVRRSCLVFEVAAWFHPLVEYSHDLNQSGLNRAIVENMNWLLHLRLWGIDARMTQMETAKAGREFVSSLSKRALRIGCDYAHCRGKENGVPATTVGSPSLEAGR